MQIALITEDQLCALKNELIEEFKKLLKTEKREQPEFLRSAQVRKMLNISDAKLQDLRIKKVFPSYWLYGSWVYKKHEILEAIENGRNGGKHV